MPTKHLLIKGKVQGVYYRASAREKAEEMGLTGWVKNKESGEVEAVVSGTESQVANFISWCWQGPPRANVSGVEVTDREEEVFEDFKVIRR